MKKVLFLIAIVSAFSLCSFAQQDTMSLALQMSSSYRYSSVNVVDKVTSNYVSATVTSMTVQNNNPEIATVVLNPNSANSIKAGGVAVGTGTAVVSCHVVYTDPGDGLQKSEDRQVLITYTVSGSPHGAKVVLTFN